MKSRMLTRGVAALTVFVILALAGCSSDDTASPPSDTGGAASEMDSDGVVRVGYDLAQDTGDVQIDPFTAKSNSQNNDALWYLVFGRFLRPTNAGTLEPDLAETVEITDSSTITITLRPDLKFSDGSPLDAAAVKAGLDETLASRASNEAGLLPPFFDLTAVTVVDPTTVTLTIQDQKAPSWFDQYIPTWATSIAKVGSTASGMPIGAGPYRFVSRQAGQAWVLERNPNYWNTENLHFARIELQQVAFAQAQSGVAAVQGGQLDISFTEPALLSGLSGSIEPYARTSPSKAVQMHMCKTDGPLADARVRAAINKGIDREGLNEAVYFGTAAPQTQLWPEDHRLNVPELDEVLAYDPDGARALLAEAGYADGLNLDMYPIQAFNIDEAAEVIQQQLAEIGITVTIVPTPDYTMNFLSPQKRGVGMYPSSQPGSNKLNSFTGTAISNPCQYEDPELEQITAEIRQVSESSEEAVQLWADASDIIVKEALMGFILWRSDLAAYNSDRIGEMEPFPTGNYLIPDPTISFIKAGS